MERFLIALDCMPGCLKIIDYTVRVLNGAQHFEFVIFHILPTVSPDKLRMDEVQRIEHRHAGRPDLGGTSGGRRRRQTWPTVLPRPRRNWSGRLPARVGIVRLLR